MKGRLLEQLVHHTEQDLTEYKAELKAPDRQGSKTKRSLSSEVQDGLKSDILLPSESWITGVHYHVWQPANFKALLRKSVRFGSNVSTAGSTDFLSFCSQQGQIRASH